MEYLVWESTSLNLDMKTKHTILEPVTFIDFDKKIQTKWNITQKIVQTPKDHSVLQVPKTVSIPLRIATMMSMIEYEIQ